MNIRNSIFKRLVWTTVFFLLTAGLAQGSERCKGKCCREVREPSDRPSPGPAPTLHPKTPLEGLLPSCHLPMPSGAPQTVASKPAPCQDENTPVCCHLVKAGAGAPALAVQGHKGVSRGFNEDMAVFIQPQYPFIEEGVRFAVKGWVLNPRAAPVPLYLLNTSFIC